MKSTLGILLISLTLAAAGAHAQTAEQQKLAQAADVVEYFSADDTQSIPIELLKRAHGIAVIPNVIRGGFILGARRGTGVLVVRTADGAWSNPAFVKLTGGSIGWQFGAESADVVLVFANDRSVKNIRSGKFTLGGDASAVAGPLGRRTTMAVTFRAEVYGYVRSTGLFAGAAFEGTRLAIDAEANARLYAMAAPDAALAPLSAEPPPGVRGFVLSLAEATEESRAAPGAPSDSQSRDGDAAPEANENLRTFPLEPAP